MPLFTCIDAIPESQWIVHEKGRPFVKFTRRELAELCEVDEPNLISAIRQWVLSQKNPRYAVAWSEDDGPSSLVIITRTADLTPK